MNSAPGKPNNPEWIVIDSDALLQILLTDNTVLLKKCKTDYGIQFLIVEAVETEILRHTNGKFKDCRSGFEKAIASGILKILNLNYLIETRGASGASLFAQADRLGAELYNYVDRGEAYSHAAAVALGVPIVTHDVTAIYKLRREGLSISRLTLRVFDIITLGLQTGALSYADCEKTRDEPLSRGEFVVECFSKTSFSKGLPLFYPRILDRDHQAIGSPATIHHLDQRIWIGRPQKGEQAAG